MKNVLTCAFKWEQYSDAYEVDDSGKKLVFKYMAQPQTGPVPGTMYHTCIGSQAFEPNTGKWYWEFTTAQDNFKIGVALKDAPTNQEMGYNSKSWAVYIQTGECEHDRQERLKPDGVQRRLWRLVVPISGGRFGCLLDTKNGTLQLFFNGEYQGMAFDEASGMFRGNERPLSDAHTTHPLRPQQASRGRRSTLQLASRVLRTTTAPSDWARSTATCRTTLSAPTSAAWRRRSSANAAHLALPLPSLHSTCPVH